MKQLTWHPIEKRWELMTPQEWEAIACGFPKDTELPAWYPLFKLNLSGAVEKYTGTKHFPYAKLYFMSTMLFMGLREPEEQYKFCLFCAEYFLPDETNNTLGLVYKARETMHAISKLVKEHSKKPKRRRRGTRR